MGIPAPVEPETADGRDGGGPNWELGVDSLSEAVDLGGSVDAVFNLRFSTGGGTAKEKHTSVFLFSAQT